MLGAFQNSLDIIFFYPKMILDKGGKKTKAANFFSHQAKTFASSCKNHFLQPRKPGLLLHATMLTEYR